MYPDHNKGFQIQTDASNYQLGTVILQNGKPKLPTIQERTPHNKIIQRWGKKELSIVMTSGRDSAHV
jgi:hypothetical protein